MPPFVDPTALLVALVLFLGGVLLLAVSADRLLGSLAGVGSAAGVSPYLLAVVLVAVDPGRWGFGVAAVLGGSPGVAVGSAFGSAYFLLGAALPAAALVSPFELRVRGRLLAPAVAAPAVLYPFLLDGRLAPWEGAALLALFAAGIWWLYRAEAGADGASFGAAPGDGTAGQGAEAASQSGAGSTSEHGSAPSDEGSDAGGATAKQAGAALLYLGGVAAGSWLAARGAGDLVSALDLDGTAFGATFVGLVLSLEGVLVVLMPVRRGRPEVAAGVLVAGVLFFATADPGLMALAAGSGGLELAGSVPALHAPALVAGCAVAALFLWQGRMSRSRGAALLLLYLGIWILAWSPVG